MKKIQKLYGSGNAEFVNVIAAEELVDLLTQDAMILWVTIGHNDEILKCSQVAI